MWDNSTIAGNKPGMPTHHQLLPPRDGPWLEQLYLNHAKAIRLYFTRRFPTDADDLVAEVFIVAWKRRDVVPEEPLPWLYSVAHNVTLHHQRKFSQRRALHRKLFTVTEPTTADHSNAVLHKVDSHKAVHDMLAKLPAKDAEILRLWAWEELDSQHIATVLGLSASGARSRLARARKRAASILGVSEDAPNSLFQPQVDQSGAQSW